MNECPIGYEKSQNADPLRSNTVSVTLNSQDENGSDIDLVSYKDEDEL